MSIFTKKKYLSPKDLGEVRELTRLVNSYRYVANTIAANTLLIPEGKKEKAKAKALADILDRQKNEYVAAALMRAGITKGVQATVNLDTGLIAEIPATE